MEEPWKGDTMQNRKISVLLPLGEGANKSEIFIQLSVCPGPEGRRKGKRGESKGKGELQFAPTTSH